MRQIKDTLPPLAELFEDGRVFRGRTRSAIPVSVEVAGYVRLPTGRLVARDNNYRVYDTADDSLAFPDVVDPGVFRVDVSVAQIDPGRPHMRRAAAARVVVKDEPARSWSITEVPEYRTPGGEDAANYGFVVDSGQGCYLDHAALPYLKRLWDTEDMYQAQEFVNDSPSRSHELVDPDSGLNIIMFDCGMGAGSYPTWVGRNESDEIVCFVSYFRLLFRGISP